MTFCWRCGQLYSRCLCVHSSGRQFKHRYLLRCAFCNEPGHGVEACPQAPARLRFDILVGEYIKDAKDRQR